MGIQVTLTNSGDEWVVHVDDPEIYLTAKLPRLAVASKLVGLLTTITPAAFIPAPPPIIAPDESTLPPHALSDSDEAAPTPVTYSEAVGR